MRVLIVDDDAELAGIVQRGLRAHGLGADVAATGEDALWMAAATDYDAIVLDVMLPGIDGLEVCRRIQAQVPVPVLMLTARDDEADILVGLAVGADDYLTKPFSMRELAARVKVLPVEQIAARLAANNYRFSSLAQEIVNSTPFKMRRAAERGDNKI
jgi:DNA-binding response OmpR family regulator